MRRSLIAAGLLIIAMIVAVTLLYRRPGGHQPPPPSAINLCRDDSGALNSPGALRRTSTGAMERCEAGRWVPTANQAANTSLGAGESNAKGCVDEEGQVNSVGALRGTHTGAIERCEEGRWTLVPQPRTSQQAPPKPVCRDDAGRTYSTGALRKNAAGAIERCEAGKWVPTK
jgi:hypothetical protein